MLCTRPVCATARVNAARRFARYYRTSRPLLVVFSYCEVLAALLAGVMGARAPLPLGRPVIYLRYWDLQPIPFFFPGDPLHGVGYVHILIFFYPESSREEFYKSFISSELSPLIYPYARQIARGADMLVFLRKSAWRPVVVGRRPRDQQKKPTIHSIFLNLPLFDAPPGVATFGHLQSRSEESAVSLNISCVGMGRAVLIANGYAVVSFLYSGQADSAPPPPPFGVDDKAPSTFVLSEESAFALSWVALPG